MGSEERKKGRRGEGGKKREERGWYLHDFVIMLFQLCHGIVTRRYSINPDTHQTVRSEAEEDESKMVQCVLESVQMSCSHERAHRLSECKGYGAVSTHATEWLSHFAYNSSQPFSKNDKCKG